MKIAHVVSTYPPYRGGMGNVAHAYVERLRARGENVHVFVPLMGPPVKDDPDYVHRIPSPLHFGNAAAVPSLFNRLSGFDLIHLHYPFFGGAEPTIVRKAVRHDQALVITYHMDTFANGFKGLVFEAHRRALFPWLMARADRILVSSMDYAKNSSLALHPNLFSRVEELPFGVDSVQFHPGDEPVLRSELGLNNEPTVLFVGGLDAAHAFKGVPVLLESLAKLSDVPWRTLIVGEGDLRPLFERQAKTLGLSGRVQFLGNVSNEQLPHLYRASQIHVLPSTSRGEAFGLAALEAAASGIPSIVSDLPGVRSVVLQNETGLRVPSDNVGALSDALRSLLTDQTKRSKLGAAARERAVKDFAWDPLMDRLQEIYKAVSR